MNINALQRFKVIESTGCFIWQGYKDRHGYGRIGSGGKSALVHRVAYEIKHGEIPAGYEIDHLCRVRDCINPSHLEPVTKRENCIRGISFTAKNAAKSQCAQGHEFNASNTYLRPNGHRDCRACIRARARSYKSRKTFKALRPEAQP